MNRIRSSTGDVSNQGIAILARQGLAVQFRSILARSPGLEGLTRDRRWLQLLRAADLGRIADAFDSLMLPDTP